MVVSFPRRAFIGVLSSSLLLAMAGAADAALTIVTDFSNFSESGNMLNSASHDREQSFTPTGSNLVIAHDSISTGSASQEIFGSNQFTPFTTDGYRLQVDLLGALQEGGNNERFGLMTSSAIPAGGPSSGDVRSAGDYFYWAYRGASVQAGMYTSGGVEQEGGLVSIGVIGTDVTGLYMERNGGAWDLGFIDENGDDIFVQSRSTINGDAITTDGSFIGLYSDMRSNNSQFSLSNLSYGTTSVPEPGSLAVVAVSGLSCVFRRRRK